MATWHGTATPLKCNVKHSGHCLATETVKCVNTESKKPTLKLLALLAWLLCGLSFCRPSWIRNTKRGRELRKERGAIQTKINNADRARVQWLVPSFINGPPLKFPLPSHIHPSTLPVSQPTMAVTYGACYVYANRFLALLPMESVCIILHFLFCPLTYVLSIPHGLV